MTAMTDTQHLGTTDKAAAAVGIEDLATFRAWAADRGLKAVRHIRLGRSTIAVWDLDEVYAAEQLGLTRSAAEKKAGHG